MTCRSAPDCQLRVLDHHKQGIASQRLLPPRAPTGDSLGVSGGGGEPAGPLRLPTVTPSITIKHSPQELGVKDELTPTGRGYKAAAADSRGAEPVGVAGCFPHIEAHPPTYSRIEVEVKAPCPSGLEVDARLGSVHGILDPRLLLLHLRLYRRATLTTETPPTWWATMKTRTRRPTATSPGRTASPP